MAHNPQAPQGPDAGGQQDPAGSTQMFRAFVDEGGSQGRAATAPGRSGPRVGPIAAVIAVLVVVAVVAWLALG